ncbi:MAG: GIY-YIG nuclease family protein [Pseudomonadota bacterium]
MQLWWLYVVRSADGSLYTGISTDPTQRLQKHESGKGARALRGRGPLELVAQCQVGDRGAASRAEYAFKQLTKADKETTLAGGNKALLAFAKRYVDDPSD